MGDNEVGEWLQFIGRKGHETVRISKEEKKNRMQPVPQWEVSSLLSPFHSIDDLTVGFT